jgi:hypothetical protein
VPRSRPISVPNIKKCPFRMPIPSTKFDKVGAIPLWFEIL